MATKRGSFSLWENCSHWYDKRSYGLCRRWLRRRAAGQLWWSWTWLCRRAAGQLWRSWTWLCSRAAGQLWRSRTWLCSRLTRRDLITERVYQRSGLLPVLVILWREDLWVELAVLVVRVVGGWVVGVPLLRAEHARARHPPEATSWKAPFDTNSAAHGPTSGGRCQPLL